MKQCPNPNCILYTRLEELPDAYLKCPGCGGMLVDANNTTSGLGTGYTRMAPSASTFHRQIKRREEATLGHSARPQVLEYAEDEQVEEVYDDQYAYVDEEEEEGSATPQRQRLSTASKVVFGVGGLMLVVACLLVASVLSGRLFARGLVVSSAAATETALAALRPAVNTPIPILPTAASSGAIYPTMAIDPPTPVAQAQPPASNPQPTAIVARPTSPAQQTGGGVLAAEIGASVYQPNDTFRLVVQAAGSVTSILVRWYGPDGNEIYKVREEYSLPQAYNADFTLKNNGPWPIGSYRADIYTNDSPLPATSLSFSVAP